MFDAISAVRSDDDSTQWMVAEYRDSSPKGNQLMSRDLRNPAMWFPDRSDTNEAVQALEMARGWEFKI